MIRNAATSGLSEEAVWLLGEARSNIAELVDDLKDCYEPEKGWPPHIDKAREVIAEIDDMLGVERG